MHSSIQYSNMTTLDHSSTHWTFCACSHNYSAVYKVPFPPFAPTPPRGGFSNCSNSAIWAHIMQWWNKVAVAVNFGQSIVMLSNSIGKAKLSNNYAIINGFLYLVLN